MWAKELNNWTMLCLYTKLLLKRNKTLTHSLTHTSAANSSVCVSVTLLWLRLPVPVLDAIIVDAATNILYFTRAVCVCLCFLPFIVPCMNNRFGIEVKMCKWKDGEWEWASEWVSEWVSERRAEWYCGWLTGMCLKMCSNSQHNGQWFTRHLIIRPTYLPSLQFSFFRAWNATMMLSCSLPSSTSCEKSHTPKAQTDRRQAGHLGK